MIFTDDWRRCGAVLALAIGLPLWATGIPDARAQTTGETVASAGPDPAAATDAIDEADLLLSDEELDDLVAPIALYPDALLAQVLVAATFPLEIIKADRWVDENAGLAADGRAEAADAEGWDPSVSVLAAGFPNVIGRMAENIDFTEDLGDAVLTQSDDVLDAIQRQRARANAVGNLETNEAQTVTVDGDDITIEPASPEVIYVPTYDPQTVYVTPAPAAPVVVQTDTGYSSGDLIMTGVLAFGAGMLVNEIFDDDDDWHGYWGPGYGHFGWHDHGFYPRPGYGYRGGNNKINIETGDITVNRNRVDIDRDGRWKPDDKRRKEARNDIANRRDPNRDRDAKRPQGTRDRERDQARDKISARKDAPSRDLKRPATSDRDVRKPANRKPAAKDSAFDSGGANMTQTRRAADRGKQSQNRAGTDRAKPAQRASGDRAAAKPQQIARPKAGAKPQRRESSKGSAFSAGSGGGSRAAASKSRGKASNGRRR